jgi:hypothetical protein
MEVHMVNRLMALLGLAAVLAAITAAMLAGAASAAAETGTATDGDGTKTSESESKPQSSPSGDQKPTGEDSEDSDIDEPEASQEETDSPTDQPTDRKSTRHEPKNNKPHTDEPTSGRPSTTRTAESAAADTASTVAKPASSPHETSTTPTESITTAEPDPIAATVAVPARSAVAVTEQVATPRAPTLINFVGSIVLNVVMGLIHTFDGAPVLPPSNNVTVRTSTLTIPVAGGRTVQADWYFPDDAETPTRLIYFQHGFGASGPIYSYTAATLAEQTNSIVVAPSLSSNFFDADAAWLGGTRMHEAVAELFVGDRVALTESASAAAGYEVTLPTRLVLAGHSLGGSLVSGAAGDMVDNGAIDDLAGVLLLDSVDVNNTVPIALQKLTGVNYRPVLNISSERYTWNMNGKVGDELEAARPGQFNGVMLVGGRHIDAMQGGNPMLQLSQYVIAGFSQPQNVEAVKTLAVGWVNDMFAGTRDGIYGAPQEVIQIDTSAGTATAVVLPFTSTRTVQATPFDGLSSLILNTLQRFFVYEPLAGRTVAVTA